MVVDVGEGWWWWWVTEEMYERHWGEGGGGEGVWGLSLSQPGAVLTVPQLHPNTMRPRKLGALSRQRDNSRQSVKGQRVQANWLIFSDPALTGLC